MTIKQLAFGLPASIIMTPREIVAIENGSRKVWDFELLAIADVLGVSISDLFRTPQRKVKKH